MKKLLWWVLLFALLAAPSLADEYFDDEDFDDADWEDEAPVRRIRSSSISYNDDLLDEDDEAENFRHFNEIKEEDLDEEEFVGALSQKRAPQRERTVPVTEVKEKQEQPFVATPAPDTEPKTFYERFLVDICFGAVIVMYILYYIFRRGENTTAAGTWAASVQPVLAQQFSYVGDGDGHVVLKSSESEYQVYASGRRYCQAMKGIMKLDTRYDLLYSVYNFLVPSSAVPDHVTLDVIMNEESMPPILFALLRKKEEKNIRATYPHLDRFGDRVGSVKLSPDFVTLSDIPEAAQLVVSKVRQTLEENLDLVEYIHFSDQPDIVPETSGVLRFSFRLAPKKEAHRNAVMLDMAMQMVDCVGRMKLSSQASARAEKRRRAALKEELKSTHEERQEAASRRRYEKMREEKEALMELPPEKQRKLEEKMRKKEFKKKMNKGAKMVLTRG
eukprot:Rmarinus@m.24958